MQRYIMTRRQFMTATIAAGLAPAIAKAASTIGARNSLPFRTLGRTGTEISIIGLGGYHVGKQSNPQESVRIIRAAIDGGITFMDNCWDYNEGESEKRMGKALLNGYRDRVFLMTKIDGRDGKTARKQLDQSLQRLQTDHIDLLQFHEVIRMSDPGRIFGTGGAIEAVLKAKEAGKVRNIGFTGHKDPSIHLEMLKTALSHGFIFDTVQMPLNVMDAHYESFEKRVLPVLLQHDIGVIGMKPLGDGIILKSGTVTPIECLHYAMNLPTGVVVTGIDSMPVLEQALTAARTFRPMSEEQVSSLLKRTAPAASNGKYEEYKTSHTYDGTFHNPEWLG